VLSGRGRELRGANIDTQPDLCDGRFMPKALPRIICLTPPGRGAIATILVEGTGAAELVDRLFCPASRKPLAEYRADQPVFGRFSAPPGPGEEMIVRRRSDDAVELHCHGGHAVVSMVRDRLVERGGQLTSWQDWAARGHSDTISAAAHVALADARTERTANILLDQYNGALRRAVDRILDALRTNDLALGRRLLEALLVRYQLGQHLANCWRVVFAGLPNVGKSSLVNRLLGYGRAIVDPASGTTRDVLTATSAVDGWPVQFADTAGLRAGGPSIERAGMELTQHRLAEADLIVLVFDSSRTFSDADSRLICDHPRAVLVHNKCDLPTRVDRERPDGLWASALSGQGIDHVLDAISGRLVHNPPSPGEGVPFTATQQEHLQDALDAVLEESAEVAMRCLLLMTGCQQS
jgi:tRNA modification GTPase